MRIVQATLFKAQCLALIDEVAATGETLVITKHGKPIAEMTAHKPPRAKSLIGLDRDRIKIVGDIIAPAYDGKWDALT